MFTPNFCAELRSSLSSIFGLSEQRAYLRHNQSQQFNCADTLAPEIGTRPYHTRQPPPLRYQFNSRRTRVGSTRDIACLSCRGILLSQKLNLTHLHKILRFKYSSVWVFCPAHSTEVLHRPALSLSPRPCSCTLDAGQEIERRLPVCLAQRLKRRTRGVCLAAVCSNRIGDRAGAAVVSDTRHNGMVRNSLPFAEPY